MATLSQINYYDLLLEKFNTLFTEANCIAHNQFNNHTTILDITRESFVKTKIITLKLFSSLQVDVASTLISRKLKQVNQLNNAIVLFKIKNIRITSDIFKTFEVQLETHQTESEFIHKKPENRLISEGMYMLNNVIYKVQIAHYGSKQLYAKALIQNNLKWKFKYEQGAIKKLKSEHRLSIDEAKCFGKLYGVCCVCGRILTDEKSIDAGIGPVCSQRL